MNRAQRRAAIKRGEACKHGYLMKTDGNAKPLCPHRCGFEKGIDDGRDNHGRDQ